MLEDISFCHYCCLRFFLFFHFLQPTASSYRWKVSATKAFFYPSFFFRRGVFKLCLWHIHHLFNCIHVWLKRIMMLGWDLTVSLSSFFPSIRFHTQRQRCGKELKACCHKWMLYNSESAWCFYFPFFPPLTSSSSTSKQFFHSKNDIQTTMNVVASHLQKMLITSVIMNVRHSFRWKFCSCLRASTVGAFIFNPPVFINEKPAHTFCFLLNCRSLFLLVTKW